MAQQERTLMSNSTGITERHARSCAKASGGRCNCTPSYQANVWDAKAGKRLRKTLPNKTAARQWRQDAMAALRAGELTADRGVMFTDAVDAWLDGLRAGHITNRSGDPYKPAAIRDYERNLRLRAIPVLGHLRLAEVTTQDVQRMVDALIVKDLAPATIDAAVTPLKAMYRRAVGRGEVKTNPTLGIEKPAVRSKPKRIVAPGHAEAMIAALPADERALWATAFYTGLRRGELIGLRAEDIDLATGVVHVRRGWDMVDGEVAPKSRQGRRDVPIPAVLRDHLDAYPLDADHAHAFGSPRWIGRTNDRARARWQERGLPTITLHEARHTYASFAIAADLNAKTLSTYMGHATIAITLDLYGHLMPGNEAEAASMLDAYFARTVAQTVAHPAKVAV
jgi:integrase